LGLVLHWRRGVFLAVAEKLPRNPEVNGAEGIFLDVRGPRLGERLAHHTDGVFHCSRLDGFLHGSLASISIPLCKDLDDGDGVVAVLEEWVYGVRQAELFPTAPMRICRSGTFRSDSKAGLFLDKAKISAESVSFCRWHIFQGMVCGKEELKWERSSTSVR
jgi:hypothetical protein